jgi:hypothetical protein
MDIDQAITGAINILPKGGQKPIITYYSGIEGIKKIYIDTLNLPAGEVIYAFLNPNEVHDALYNWLTSEYIAQRVKNGIQAHVFITDKHDSPRVARYKKLDDKENRITHIVESYNKPFECEVDIYGGKIAFINYNPKAEIMGIIINHPIIASTLKAFYLHYLWKI